MIKQQLYHSRKARGGCELEAVSGLTSLVGPPCRDWPWPQQRRHSALMPHAYRLHEGHVLLLCCFLVLLFRHLVHNHRINDFLR